MRLRLFSLLLVAIASGCVVGFADSARAGKPRPAALRAPAALPMDRAPNRCPVPSELRDAFHAAAGEADLPAAMLVAVADRFESTELAFAAYNAGPTAVANVTTQWRKLVGCT